MQNRRNKKLFKLSLSLLLIIFGGFFVLFVFRASGNFNFTPFIPENAIFSAQVNNRTLFGKTKAEKFRLDNAFSFLKDIFGAEFMKAVFTADNFALILLDLNGKDEWVILVKMEKSREFPESVNSSAINKNLIAFSGSSEALAEIKSNAGGLTDFADLTLTGSRPHFLKVYLNLKEVLARFNGKTEIDNYVKNYLLSAQIDSLTLDVDPQLDFWKFKIKTQPQKKLNYNISYAFSGLDFLPHDFLFYAENFSPDLLLKFFVKKEDLDEIDRLLENELGLKGRNISFLLSPANGKMGLAAGFFNEPQKDFKGALEKTIALLFPEEREIILPDDSRGTEYIASFDSYKFTTRIEDNLAINYLNNPFFTLAYASKDRRTIISDSPSLLKNLLVRNDGYSVSELNSRCWVTDRINFSILNNSQNKFKEDIFPLSYLPEMLILISGQGNEISGCFFR